MKYKILIVDDEKMIGSYQLQLIKQDKITKAKLSGGEFNVQIGNSEAKKYTTDANGDRKSTRLKFRS